MDRESQPSNRTRAGTAAREAEAPPVKTASAARAVRAVTPRWRDGATLATIACLGLGAAARLRGYLDSSPFWLDELFVVDNLRQRDWSQLLQPLDHGQNAPVGWLMLEKACLELLGSSEMALRLPALLASLLCLPLTVLLARRALGPTYALLPVALVSFSPFVVWQSFQVKQYSWDLLLCTALLALACWAGQGPPRRLFVLGVTGLASLAFSMTAIFPLAAAGLALLVQSLRAAGLRSRSLVPLGLMGISWLVAFALNYFLFLRPGNQPPWLAQYWAHSMLPQPASLTAGWSWLRRVVAAALEDPAGLVGAGVPASALLAAGLVIWLWQRARARHAPSTTSAEEISGRSLAISMSGLTVLFTLCAAALRLYPFALRLVLFLVPLLGILLGYTLHLMTQGWPKLRWPVAGLTAVLAAMPLFILLPWLIRGGLPLAADTRGAFEILRTEHRRGEAVVLDHPATYAWSIYGTQDLQPIVPVPSAWNERDRVLRLGRRLHRLAARPGSPRPVWVVLSRVGPRVPMTFWPSVSEDLTRRSYTLPLTYGSQVARKREWSEPHIFEPAIPQGWRIAATWDVQGVRLWRLERVGL